MSVAAAARPAAEGVAGRPVRLLLLGNPNTGKTTLFNRLCGVRAKTANFPGTTTDLRVGRLSLPGGSPLAAELVDLPGIYSLTLDLPESKVARGALSTGDPARPEAAVVVVDATNLVRHLHLVGELQRDRVPLVVALNMIDLARRRGLSIDVAALSDALGVPVVAVAARSGEGVAELAGALRRAVDGGSGSRRPGGVAVPAATPDAAGNEAEALDAWAERVVAASVGGKHAAGAPSDLLLDRLDVAFTHPLVGLFVFLAVMAGLFWTIFALASVPMDLIEATFAHLGGYVEGSLPEGAVRELLVGGLIGGIAGTVVFLPQICLLFFLITLLEDTGYLARAAFVMDRLLSRFGLPGNAFVPLLSSHACAIPGILSARLIPDRHDRFTTILVAPFMSCSARMPVYVLLTHFLFGERPLYAGLAFAGCYLLGAVAALGSAMLARRTILPGRSRPMVMELPTYKRPSLRVALATSLEQGWRFLTTVGTVILAICLVMWWLSAYPKVEPPPAATALSLEAQQLATTAPERSAAMAAESERLAGAFQQEQSYAGRLGRFFEPAFAPLGYDWRLTIGVLTSFAAREVFVSTLAVITAAEDDSELGVLQRIHGAARDDGSPLLTPATAVSLLVFFVLAMQCLSTVVTVKREMREWKWAILQFVWMTALAWLLAFAAYQGMRAGGIA